jgi:hypothetical protein
MADPTSKQSTLQNQFNNGQTPQAANNFGAKAPSFAPKDSVFVQQANNREKKS